MTVGLMTVAPAESSGSAKGNVLHRRIRHELTPPARSYVLFPAHRVWPESKPAAGNPFPEHLPVRLSKHAAVGIVVAAMNTKPPRHNGQPYCSVRVAGSLARTPALRPAGSARDSHRFQINCAERTHGGFMPGFQPSHASAVTHDSYGRSAASTRGVDHSRAREPAFAATAGSR